MWGRRGEANREQCSSTLMPEVWAGSAVPGWGPPGPCAPVSSGTWGTHGVAVGTWGKSPPGTGAQQGLGQQGSPRGGPEGEAQEVSLREGLCAGQGQGRTALPPRGGEAPGPGPPRELSAGKGCPQGLASVRGDLQDSPLVSSRGGGSAAEGGTQLGEGGCGMVRCCPLCSALLSPQGGATGLHRSLSLSLAWLGLA